MSADNKEPNTPSRRRARGNRRAERAAPPAPAYVKRVLPFYEMLGEEALVKLEEQADWIIQEVGMEFRDDPVA